MSIESTAGVIAKWLRREKADSKFIVVRTHINMLVSELENTHRLYEHVDFYVYEALDDKDKCHIIYSISRKDNV